MAKNFGKTACWLFLIKFRQCYRDVGANRSLNKADRGLRNVSELSLRGEDFDPFAIWRNL